MRGLFGMRFKRRKGRMFCSSSWNGRTHIVRVDSGIWESRVFLDMWDQD